MSTESTLSRATPPLPTQVATPLYATLHWDLLGLAAAAVLLISVAMPVGHLPGMPLCLFKAYTGIPCAGCGLTRAFCSIGHGEFAVAWSYNPFSFPLYTGFVTTMLIPLARRRWPTASVRFLKSRWLWRAVVAMGLAMLAFGVVRAIHAVSTGSAA